MLFLGHWQDISDNYNILGISRIAWAAKKCVVGQKWSAGQGLRTLDLNLQIKNTIALSVATTTSKRNRLGGREVRLAKVLVFRVQQRPQGFE